jgi:hypothetical protein
LTHFVDTALAKSLVATSKRGCQCQRGGGVGTFSWAARPTPEAEFKALMQAIDTALTAASL